jgi:hypothetical protein
MARLAGQILELRAGITTVAAIWRLAASEHRPTDAGSVLRAAR